MNPEKQVTPALEGEELKRVMAKSPEWPNYEGKDDAWILIHNALRWDMDAIMKAVAKAKQQTAEGTALAKWQVENFHAFFDYFYKVLHAHHEHEEEIFFPVMSARFTMPPKMTADHQTLVSLLDESSKLVHAIPVGGDPVAAFAALEKVETTFGKLKSECEEHFREEEEIALPLVRKYFTQKEFNNGPEKQLLKHLTPDDLAYLMRAEDMCEDPVKQGVAMTNLRVPGPVQALIMRPAIRKDQALRVRLIKELHHGEQLPVPATGCACAIM